MPKFTIKDLMIATAMVAIGLVTARLARSPNIVVDEPFRSLVPLQLRVAGCAIAGAGVLYPFDRWKLGFAIGGFIAFLYLAKI